MNDREIINTCESLGQSFYVLNHYLNWLQVQLGKNRRKTRNAHLIKARKSTNAHLSRAKSDLDDILFGGERAFDRAGYQEHEKSKVYYGAAFREELNLDVESTYSTFIPQELRKVKNLALSLRYYGPKYRGAVKGCDEAIKIFDESLPNIKGEV